MPKREDSESESLLIGKDGPTNASYTEEGASAADGVTMTDIREMDYVDTDVSVLSQFHEDALGQVKILQRRFFFSYYQCIWK